MDVALTLVSLVAIAVAVSATSERSSAAAIRTSLVDFTANKRSIALLSVGLVLFTAGGVAVLVHAVLPVGLGGGSWPPSCAAT